MQRRVGPDTKNRLFRRRRLVGLPGLKDGLGTPTPLAPPSSRWPFWLGAGVVLPAEGVYGFCGGGERPARGECRMAGWLPRRIRVSGLMLAILVFGLWLGYRVNLARDQRLAVAAVHADRGWVHYADEFAMGPVKVPPGNTIWKPSWGALTPGKGPMAPDWLRRVIGDEGLRHLEGLKGLQRLSLQNAKVSEAAKERLLKAIPGLQFNPN